MSEYPPKLLAVEEAAFGSVLSLSDGTRVPTNVRPSRLAETLAEYSSRSLASLLVNRSLGVYADAFQTTPDEWARISQLLQSNADTRSVLRSHSTTWECISEPYDLVLTKPHRVYSGLDQALYTFHPFQFREDPNRPHPWRRALLSAPGGWLFETWVELLSGEVEIAAHSLPGHFLE